MDLLQSLEAADLEAAKAEEYDGVGMR